MSHFLTFVLIDPAEADVERKVDELLDPYFEYSPKRRESKFDGCVIGGRYDGQINGAAPMYNLSPAEFQARYGLDVVKPVNNVRPASDVPPGLVPYAVVTPEGEWIDCEGKAWQEWAAEARELLGRYGGHLAVAVDCHC